MMFLDIGYGRRPGCILRNNEKREQASRAPYASRVSSTGELDRVLGRWPQSRSGMKSFTRFNSWLLAAIVPVLFAIALYCGCSAGPGLPKAGSSHPTTYANPVYAGSMPD